MPPCAFREETMKSSGLKPELAAHRFLNEFLALWAFEVLLLGVGLCLSHRRLDDILQMRLHLGLHLVLGDTLLTEFLSVAGASLLNDRVFFSRGTTCGTLCPLLFAL